MVVACDREWNIGKNGSLPWKHISEDMKIFKSMTTAGPRPGVVMGRKTWESLPKIHRPLCDRVNFVVSRTVKKLDGAFVAKTVVEVIDLAKANNISTLWVIGGEQIYYEFMGMADEIFITRIDHSFDGCDAKFPKKDLEQFYNMVSQTRFSTDSYNFSLEKWSWLAGQEDDILKSILSSNKESIVPKRVIVLSPCPDDTDSNIQYGVDCVHDSYYNKNEAPFAYHLLPGSNNNKHRIVCYNMWLEVADLVAVYTDNGISDEMRTSIRIAIENGKQIEYRSIK